MNGNIWWNRITNPSQLIEDAADDLIDSESVILRLPENLPWKEDFFDSLRSKLERYNCERSFEIVSAKGVSDPGEFLLNKFFIETERSKFWQPTYHTYENFMAKSSETVMNHRYVCVSDISPSKVQIWIDSVGKYIECVDDKDERAVFILIIKESGDIESRGIKQYRYNSYITDFDCLLLCQTLLSSEKFSTIQKEYISQLACNLAGNDYELAGVFVGYGLDLARDPDRIAETVFKKNNTKVTNLEFKINSAVWETQIKTIFPKMEKDRRYIIDKYHSDLKKYLPIKSGTGEKIENPLDLEIGQLFMLAHKRHFADWKDLRTLETMKDARNALAHLEAIEFIKLEDMEIF